MLVGHKVILRTFRKADLEGLYDLAADTREIGPYWPLGAVSEPRWAKRFEEDGFWGENVKIFLITDHDGRRLGQIGAYKASNSYQGWELGYRIYKPADRGKGYITEAVRMASAYLFAEQPLGRLQLLISPLNEGSKRVAEKVGFVLEGTMRQAIFNHGEYQDLLVYSMVREEAPKLADLLAPLTT